MSEFSTNTETVVRLKAEHVEFIKTEPALIGLIAQRAGKGLNTVRGWLSRNDEKLTMAVVLTTIREYRKIPADKTLTELVKPIAA
jgi:hypothetical protein